MDKLTHTPNAETGGEALTKLLEMIADIQVAMLTTVEEDGYLRSRPMMTQDTEFDGALWFFSSRHDGKAEDLEKDSRVNLAYAMPDKQRYVSVSGLAEIIQDDAKKKELWKEVYRAWFPKGVDDPSIALLKVYVDKAEYWDAPSSRFVEIVGFAKAVLTGQRYNPDDSHDKIVFDAKGPSSNAEADRAGSQHTGL